MDEARHTSFAAYGRQIVFIGDSLKATTGSGGCVFARSQGMSPDTQTGEQTVERSTTDAAADQLIGFVWPPAI